MFTVEWLKDGKMVHRQAVLGARIADVLKIAREPLPAELEASGVVPDAIRVTDHMTNQVTIESAFQSANDVTSD